MIHEVSKKNETQRLESQLVHSTQKKGPIGTLHYYVLCSLSSLYEGAEPNTQKQQKMEP